MSDSSVSSYRLCRCGKRISALKADAHKKCVWCHDFVCDENRRCVECVVWPDIQFQAYLKHRKVLGIKAASKEKKRDV